MKKQAWVSGLIILTLALAGCGGGAFNAPSGSGGFGNTAGGGGSSGTLTQPPPQVTVTISPSSASLAPGQQLQFSVVVQNATNSTVTWSVNGVPGGNSTVGTISGSGLYTAPATAPNPNTVIVSAASVVSPTSQSSATVVIAAPPQQVSVSVSPSTVTLLTGATTAFSAVVTGTTNTAVSWSVNGIPGGNAAVGTITGAGVYTAPASVPTPANVTITATSAADPSATGTATVLVQQQIQVSINPPNVSVLTDTTQQFTATVTGTTNQSVTWAVNGIAGGNTTVGTIDANGLYTAPSAVPSPGTVTISATSAVSPTAIGFATVSITLSPGVTVSVTPATATVDINQSVQFSATVSGLFRGIVPSQQVVWYVNNIAGGDAVNGFISSTGLYTAPPAVPFPNTITIRAQSVTDNSAFGFATVTITAPTLVTVTVAPGTASIQVNGSQQFTASVSGTANQGVTWSVNGVPGGNAQLGTISSSGIYTAPATVPTPASVIIAATSVVDPSATGTATVTVLSTPVPVTVTVSPSTANLQTSQQLLFTATVSGSSNTAVNWSVNGVPGGNTTVGTISAAGLYTSPASVPSPATVSITATSVSNPTASGTASVTIQAAASIAITPTTVSVQTGLGAQFFVTLTGVSNPAVTWAVNGITGGNSTFGTIDANGLYLAPAAVPSPATVAVSATSVQNSSLVANATVTIVAPVVVTIAPTTATLNTGATQQFTATVTGTTNTAVVWKVNGIAGGNATVGTVSATGLYTAPSNLLLTQTFTVTAESVANPSQSASALVTVNAPISVSVSPGSASIQTGQTQQFSATVTGTANVAVNWTVSCSVASCGTVSASGLYTAPATIPPGGPLTVTVTATSQANGTSTGSAVITVTAPPISVTVNPSSATISAGGTQQFTATVTNTTNTAVTWTISGAGCSGPGNPCGTINASTGLYTAPAIPPTPNAITITATSQADPTRSGTASVTIQAVVTITVSPSAATVQVSTTRQFTATVNGTTNTGVNWSVSCSVASCGTISATGLYTAPSAVSTSLTVTVTAQSQADPTKTASATVTVPAIVVTVSPATATISANGTQTFTAVVQNTTNTAVTWSLSGTGCSGAGNPCGTINPTTGVYVAPAIPPTPSNFTVIATSVADSTKTGTSAVTIVAAVAVSVSPSTATVFEGATQQFTANVTGTANTNVTWTVTCSAANCGTVSPTGLYTAPTTVVTSTLTVTVTATSQADNTKSASATVTVPAIVVTVSPASATISANGTQTFTANVQNTGTPTVNWSLTGAGCAGAGNPCGTINATTGVYVAPAIPPSPNSIAVQAASTVDPSKIGTATVTIAAVVTVSVSPSSATVVAGNTQLFTATVNGTSNTAVTWTVTGAGCSGAACGTISATGLYTAPLTPPSPATVTVTATSVADSTKSASATVTIQPNVTITISPTAPSLTVNQTQQFTATVTGTGNTAVTWRVNGIVGGNSAVGTITTAGLYTAPALVPSPNTLTVTATSVADPTKVATATVTITSPPVGVIVSVFPRDRLLPIGLTQQFTAHVFRTNNRNVTWSISGAGCSGAGNPCGTISSTGLYTPPATPPTPPQIQIKATSQADPTASMTVNATIVVGVVVSPASVKLNVRGTQQFTATVTGSSNQSVTWAVVGSGCNLPGNPCGTIDSTGLYTAPSTAPRPGMFTIVATSAADPTLPGVATVTILPNSIKLSPSTATVLPGGSILFQLNTNVFPQPGTPGASQPLVTWTVNGVVGGNATVGRISPSGVYTAPQTIPSPATVTVGVSSVITPSVSATAQVTVAVPTAASSVTQLSANTKIQPYDQITGTANFGLNVAANQYASWQVLVQAVNEDLTGVDVTISDLTGPNGARIPASNAVIYLEKYVNISNVSRPQGLPGEWPDPLIPKVDPFVQERRNAFPFSVNRISPAYKIYPTAGGDTVNTNMGAGKVVSGGTSTATGFRHFVIVIDRAGTVGAGSATFKWSSDGGATFPQTNVPIPNSNPIPLADGVTVAFQKGNVSGVPDFNVGDTFWIFAGPSRNQPVWIDLFVPGNTPAGSYSGNVTVVRQGKPNVTLAVTVNVRNFVLPVSSTIPVFFKMNWNALQNAHYLNTTIGSQTLALGQLYGVACLINRISCDTASTFLPSFTFNADGTVATSDYSSFDQATAPLANGSITPHGEQLSLIRLPLRGSTPSEQFFATQHMLNTFQQRGWRTRVFDLSFDEPTTPQDFLNAMDRTALVRSVDPLLRSMVSTDISRNNFNLIGYTNVWATNWNRLENKEFLDGPNPSSRSFYDNLAPNDKLWWYDSCLSHGCGPTGSSPRHDSIPSFIIDTPATLNRVWGLAAVQPYRISGLFYQDTIRAYSRFFFMSIPRIDVWESTFYSGGNGDGTLFYPGRPSDIGGTTHIPVESLRLKHIRNALVDMETAEFLEGRGDGPFVGQQIFAAVNSLYNTDPSSSAIEGVAGSLINQAGQPPLPPAVATPAAGQCYTDPVTGNQVCRVTDRTICRAGGRHYYSYWPIFNATSTHLIVSCGNWVGGSGFASSANALLIRESDLAILGDAFAGAPSGMDTSRAFWSYNNPNLFYNYSGLRLYKWDPINRSISQANALIKDFTGTSVGGRTAQSIRLAYVSFDDRYFLVELLASGSTFGLAVFDSVANTVSTLDLTQFSFYDEAVLTKNNRVWVVTGTDSFSYTIDFSSRVRVSEAGHHAHGMLGNGTAVAVKSSSNRSCPASSAAGVPGSSWKPTALLLNNLIDTTGASTNQDPIASQIFKVACTVPGQHELGHFSWFNTSTDRFFISTFGYSGFGPDPIADGVVKDVLTQFDSAGNPTVDAPQLLVHHRSDKAYGYFALPRASCNKQGTRCVFASTFTVQTDNLDPQDHIYLVRFAP